MSDNRSAGRLLADARQARNWRQKDLAEVLGYSVVLISKIEGGNRAMSDRFLEGVRDHLPEAYNEIRSVAEAEKRAKKSTPKIVDALRLTKENVSRGKKLRKQFDTDTANASRIEEALATWTRKFHSEVVDAALQLLARVQRLPESLISHGEALGSDMDSEFALKLDEAQIKTSRSIFALISAGLLGFSGGSALGAGAAGGAYSAVAGIASASTGTAIASLSGAAASSATLAALGGGSLAAGGLGMAGGTAVLAGIVAVPILLVTAGAITAHGPRMLEKQVKTARELDEAERIYAANREITSLFVDRAEKVIGLLNVACAAGRVHSEVVESVMGDVEAVDWEALPEAAQHSLERLAELMVGGLTLLALPIRVNAKVEDFRDQVAIAAANEQTLPDHMVTFEHLPKVESDYTDYAIEELRRVVIR